MEPGLGSVLAACAGHADLGQFHLDAQLDLGQHGVEAGSPVGSASPAAADLSRASAPVSSVPDSRPSFSASRASSAPRPRLTALLAPLARLIDALQREQRIDAADIAHAGRRGRPVRAGLSASRLKVPEAERRAVEAAAGAALPGPWIRMVASLVRRLPLARDG